MQEVHEYQMIILRQLLFNPGSRFRDLNKTEVNNDHFSFHVNKLIKLNLIEKKNQKYFLTEEGKEFANKMDTDSLNFEKQAKISIALHAFRKNKSNIEILVHKRLKEPYYGWYGSYSGKIRRGETPLECARREFYEEAGLKGDFELKIIVHYFDFNKEGKLLEDKFFFVYKIDNVVGTLINKTEEGENIWMSAIDCKKLRKTFVPYDTIFRDLKRKKLFYEDRTRFVDKY